MNMLSKSNLSDSCQSYWLSADVVKTGSSTKQGILNHLLKQGQATSQELAQQLAVSPQAIRRHLKDLDAEGLVCSQSLQSGMGRPQHVYQLSRGGRERFPDRHDAFAIELLDTLTETMGHEQVSSLLRKQWERKALDYQQQLGNGPLAERLASLVQLRRAEGYMAEYYPPAGRLRTHHRHSFYFDGI